MKQKNMVQKVVLISFIGNTLLTVIKLTGGFLGNSQSLISDGYNSLSDILVSFLLLVILRIAYKAPDENHPYGHEKFEGVVYLLLGILLLVTAGGIAYSGIESIYSHIVEPNTQRKPEVYTLIFSGVALVIKTFLYVINHVTAKKYHSSSIAADAKNHLFDILSTLSSLIGILLALFGFLYFEAIASIVIAVMVSISSFGMIKEAIAFLTDESPSKEMVDEIHELIESVEGVIRVDDLKVRRHMNRLYVDVEIAVDKHLNFQKAHQVSELVHHKVEKAFDVIHCMVHANPL